MTLLALMLTCSSFIIVGASPRVRSASHIQRMIERESSAAGEAMDDAEATINKILRTNLRLGSYSIGDKTPIGIGVQAATVSSDTPYATRIGKAYSIRSPIAQKISEHQNNCDLPIRRVPLKHNAYETGLGADIHIWSQDLCWAIEVEVLD